MSEQVVASCSLDQLGQLKEQYKESGFFLLVSQPGCGHCEEMKGVLKDIVKEKVPIIDAGLEDGECKSLAEQLNVGVTPTLFFYKGSTETMRLEPDGKLTWDDMRQKIRELVAGSSPAPV